MITGANTNVRHRGIIFHVQTEDSGRANPHIISHLYHHGTILASRKTEYSDHVESEDLERVVRGMIESQHKAMLKSLKGGEYDDLIDERLGKAVDGKSGKAGKKTAPSVEEGPKTDGLETPTPMPEVESDAAARPAAARAPATASARAFGEGIVSQKPLDEVILEYLAEKARDRAAERADKTAQKSRSSG
jgi:hypothetical protein